MEQSRKEIATQLYKIAFQFFKIFNHREQTITFKEVHLNTHLRADILNLSWKDSVSIIELKSCREDFEADHKWEKYMDFCDYFWFMCPWGTIQGSEIPKEVGLVYVKFEEGKKPYFSIVKRPKRLKPKLINNEWLRKTYKKLAFRTNIKVNEKVEDLNKITFFEEKIV